MLILLINRQSTKYCSSNIQKQSTLCLLFHQSSFSATWDFNIWSVSGYIIWVMQFDLHAFVFTPGLNKDLNASRIWICKLSWQCLEARQQTNGASQVSVSFIIKSLFLWSEGCDCLCLSLGKTWRNAVRWLLNLLCRFLSCECGHTALTPGFTWNLSGCNRSLRVNQTVT